jgi:hypothetical protein
MNVLRILVFGKIQIGKKVGRLQFFSQTILFSRIFVTSIVSLHLEVLDSQTILLAEPRAKARKIRKSKNRLNINDQEKGAHASLLRDPEKERLMFGHFQPQCLKHPYLRGDVLLHSPHDWALALTYKVLGGDRLLPKHAIIIKKNLDFK